MPPAVPCLLCYRVCFGRHQVVNTIRPAIPHMQTQHFRKYVVYALQNAVLLFSCNASLLQHQMRRLSSQQQMFLTSAKAKHCQQIVLQAWPRWRPESVEHTTAQNHLCALEKPALHHSNHQRQRPRKCNVTAGTTVAAKPATSLH
jgi:hypothetical protein